MVLSGVCGSGANRKVGSVSDTLPNQTGLSKLYDGYATHADVRTLRASIEALRAENAELREKTAAIKASVNKMAYLLGQLSGLVETMARTDAFLRDGLVDKAEEQP